MFLDLHSRRGSLASACVLLLLTAAARSILADEPVAAAPHPNLVFAVRRETVAAQLAKLQRDVQHREYVQHTIVGTPVAGMTYTTAKVGASLAPLTDGVGLRFELKGSTHCPSNSAAQKPVVLFSQAQTSLHAVTYVMWDGRRLIAGPTTASCQTRSEMVDVSVERRRLVRRNEGGLVDRFIRNTAMNRASELQAQAEAESSRIAESQLRQRVDRDLGAQLQQWNAQVDEFYVRPLEKLKAFAPSRLQMQGDYLTFSVTQPDAAGRAASEPANLKDFQADFVAGIHESVVAAYSRPLLGGTICTDRDLGRIQEIVLGESTHELRSGVHAPWSFVFDKDAPLAVEMEADAVRFILRGEQLTFEGKTVATPWQVEAAYKLVPTRSALGFHRQGGLTFRWRDEAAEKAAQRDADHRAAEQFLQRKFVALLLDEIYLDGLSLPRGGHWEQFEWLHVDTTRIRGEWLYLVSFPEPRKPEPVLAEGK